MSNVHTDDDGFEYDGNLLELIDADVFAGDVMDDEDGLVSVVFTMEELTELGAFLEGIFTAGLQKDAPAVVTQVIDFAHEVAVGRE